MGKKDKAAVVKEQITMPLTIDIHLGQNTFNVSGDLPDLQHIVTIFGIWVNAQQGEDSDPALLADLTNKLKGQNEGLQSAVNTNTPI